nr:gluconate 2-dehydrogenase subunit 3 family protein [Pseudoxanthomonas indica]
MIAAATGAAMIGMPALVLAEEQGTVAHANSAFSPAEVALLDDIADTILPRTKTPGAKDAGAGAFMAQFVTDCYTAKQQTTFRAGLADIEQRAKGRFVTLKPQARTELLRALDLEAKALLRVPDVAGGAKGAAVTPHYFTMIKQLAIFSFFTSRAGATEALQYVAVPGRYDGDLPYVPGTPAWATD